MIMPFDIFVLFCGLFVSLAGIIVSLLVKIHWIALPISVSVFVTCVILTVILGNIDSANALQNELNWIGTLDCNGLSDYIQSHLTNSSYPQSLSNTALFDYQKDGCHK